MEQEWRGQGTVGMKELEESEVVPEVVTVQGSMPLVVEQVTMIRCKIDKKLVLV